MDTHQRSEYVRKFHELSMADVIAKKSIVIASPQSAINTPVLSLSLDLKAALPELLHVKQIEKRALYLLNLEKAISLAPSLRNSNQVKYHVAGRIQSQYVVPQKSDYAHVYIF